MTLSQHVQPAAAVQHVLAVKWEGGKVIHNTAAELSVVFPLSLETLKTLKPLRRYKHLKSFTYGPRVQEVCESRGGRPGLSVLMNLTDSVDVKQHCTMLRSLVTVCP